MLRKISIFLGVFLFLLALNATAGCYATYRTSTYEVIDTCNYACGPTCVYSEYEYYESPRRHAHRGVGEMEEYIWIDP